MNIDSFRTESDLTYSFYPGEEPILVFIHGVMDRGRSFLRVKSRLKSRAILIYDRRGYGSSRNLNQPFNSTVEDSIFDLSQLISNYKVILIGHSYGAVISLGACLKLDNIIGAVIYEAPLSWLPWWATMNSPSSKIFTDQSPKEAVDNFMNNVLGPDRWKRVKPTLKEDLYQQGDVLIAELANLRTSQPFNINEITQPIILSFGSESTDRQKKGMRYLSENILNSQVVEILGAKHNAHMTHYKDFANMIESAISFILTNQPDNTLS
jgi:pimeloyl-ACP methyl ester carboxylesterase